MTFSLASTAVASRVWARVRVLSSERLLGCGALHFYSPTLAEIRSLAVAEAAKTHGVGRMLVEALVKEAMDYELDAAFAFTYVTEFFRKVGFQVVERGVLPNWVTENFSSHKS